MFLVIVMGILASFGLTILSVLIWYNTSANRVWRMYPEFCGVAVIVGAIVGLAARKQARVAAALSLAPWSVALVVGANAGGSSLSRWAITIGLVSAYFALGVGAAALVGHRMARSSARGSHSRSQGRA